MASRGGYWLLPYLGYEVGAGIGNLTESNTPKGPRVERLFLHGADKNTSTKTGFVAPMHQMSTTLPSCN